MTSDEAFLREIVEHPDEDGPRLVYADWLEEHSDPDRADFIRVQCLLAILPEENPTRPELEAHEQRLLEEHADAWLGPLRHVATRWAFRRGFLAEAAVPPQDYLDRTTELRRLVPLGRVVVDLDRAVVPQSVLDWVPASVAVENGVLPLGWRGRTLVLAMRNTSDADLLLKLQFILNRDVEPVPAVADDLAAVIVRHYGDENEPVSVVCTTFAGADHFALGPPASDDPAIVKLVGLIVEEALSLRAAEVQIEPEADRLRVRYHIGGKLVERDSLPYRLLDALVERLRLVSAQHPGRLRGQRADGTPFDLGVDIQPTDLGPRVVIRTA
jgi:type IV pilus assembly protein PilB